MSDYLDRFLASLRDVKEVSDGWVATCPAEGHGEDGTDSTPSLRISIGDAGRILVKCRVGCPLDSVLAGCNQSKFNLFPNDEEPATPRSATPSTHEGTEEFHRVYSRFLNLLGLSSAHSGKLSERGLDVRLQEVNGYKTYDPRSGLEIALTLYKEFGDALFLVPGFLDQDGTPTVSPVSSTPCLLIPVRDPNGKIGAIKVRRDSSPKYVYLSGEISSGAPCHFSLGYDSKSETVLVTEGELKADVWATDYVDALSVIGIPGVALWNRCIHHIRSGQYVWVAYDWPDVMTKSPVRQALKEFILWLYSNENHVSVATWAELTCKGIDDLISRDLRPEWVDGYKALNMIEKLEGHSEPSLLAACSVDVRLPFPVDTLPPVVQEFIREVSTALPCPADFVGVSCLGVASAAIGTSRRVKMKNSYKEYVPLYIAVVAEPSTLKSPGIDTVMRPMINMDHKLYSKWSMEHAEWRKRSDLWKLHKSVWDLHYKCVVKDAIEAKYPLKDLLSESEWIEKHPGLEPTGIYYRDPPDPVPTEPKLESCRVQDCTIEGLVNTLANSTRGAVGYYDELRSLFKDFNKYRSGEGSDRQFFLSAWQCSTYKAIRKGSPTVDLESPFLSIIGGIQPGWLGDIKEDRGREDGFFARFLFCMPDADVLPEFTWHKDVKPSTTEAWEDLIIKLRDPVPEGSETTAMFSLEAQEVFNVWHEKHRKEPDHEDFPVGLRGSWGKMKAYAFRLSLILHVLENVDADFVPALIQASTMEKSLRLCEYFKSHAKYVMGKTTESSPVQDAKEFVKWVMEEKNGRCKPRELMQKKKWGVRQKSHAYALMSLASDLDLGEIKDELGKNGQRIKVFEVK